MRAIKPYPNAGRQRHAPIERDLDRWRDLASSFGNSACNRGNPLRQRNGRLLGFRLNLYPLMRTQPRFRRGGGSGKPRYEGKQSEQLA